MFTGKFQLPLLNVTDADTLVFISPNTSPNPPHRVSSRALLASGSTVFRELLGPTSQHRALRKRKLVNNLPQGIKYAVDLSPPEEGPEALNAVLKLYCPKVVLEWQSSVTNGAYLEDDDYRYQGKLSRPGGEGRTADLDKHGTWETMEEDCDSVSDVHPSEVDVARREFETEGTGTELTKKERIEPAPPAAHSTRRHSAAIERVLHILHGLDPQLCTTPMWYTVCKVAVLLNCESAVVDHATSWLYADGRFIGKYPEIVMEVANDLRSKVLFKDAFALLVGKMLRTTDSDSEQDAHCFDRIPEAALPWKRNIMHACWSLKERAQTAHHHLMCAHEWLHNPEWISEYAQLARILSIPNLDHEVYEASIALRDAITDAIVSRLAPVLRGPCIPGGHLRYSTLLFTRSFWQQLMDLSADCFWEMSDGNVCSAQRAWQGCVRGYNMRRIKGKRPHSKQAGPLKRILDVLKVRGEINHDETPKIEPSRAGDSQPVPPPRRVASGDEKHPDRPDSQTLPDDFNALDFQQDEDIHPPSYKPSSEPPPDYAHIDEASEDPVTRSPPRGMRIEIANPIKRKSMFEYSWDDEVAEGVASREELSSVAPRIGNSSKRRCSLEKSEDEKASVCSVSTVAGNGDYGEPEVFHISGVHEAIDHQTTPLDYDRKGKGKAVDIGHVQGPLVAEEPRGSSSRVLPNLAGAIAEDDPATWLGVWPREIEGSHDPLLGYSWDERELFQELCGYSGSGNPESSSAAGVGAYATLDYALYDRTAAENPNRTQDYNRDYNTFADLDMEGCSGSRGSRQNMDQVLPPRDPPEISSPQHIALDLIWKQSVSYVRLISSPFTEVPTMYDPTSWPNDGALLCLSDAEWKFLPLWADGLDDGTGGVFGDPPPEPVPQSPPEDCGEGTEVESLAGSNYSDCLLDMVSVASFEARVFSEDEDEDEDMDSSRSTSTVEDEDEEEEEEEDEDEDEEWAGDSDGTEDLGWEECF
ncbi:hypothetical protein C7212DRAFT_288957 [Tuber magnatum]|uniref:BTB domain-containing protein n=1 Tax=Tuber magnatum TaxID=42249 RepID=A0A317T2Q4_9PEZI|nr:hypothetical protein C7212DRAFT_288957 [Tuber magnatum]